MATKVSASDLASSRQPSAARAARLFWLSPLILLVAISLFLFNVYRSRLGRWDDAYITYRYAQHLAQGYGLTWNIGGERAEGFTSLLHVLLVALGIKLGIGPEFGSLLISVVSVLGTAGLMVRILLRQFGSVHPVAAVLLALYLIDEVTTVHSVSGMETPLFVFLLCAGLSAALSFVDSPRWGSAISLALLVFLSVLCRPEGVLFGGTLYLVLLFCGLQAQTASLGQASELRRLAVSAALLVFLGLAYAAWKYEYFGYLLPNSYYVKSNRISSEGWIYVLSYLKHVALWFVPVTLSAVFLLSREMVTAAFCDPNKRAKLLLTLGPPVLGLFYYSTIIHEMGMSHRFSYPTFFYFALAAAFLATIAISAVQPVRLHVVTVVLATIFSLAIVVTYVYRWSTVPPSDIGQYHLKIAQALRDTGLGPHGTVLCDAAGLIPYLSGFNHVDRVGLTDNFLSGRKRLTTREREQYIWSRRIDVYLGYEPSASPGAWGPADDPRMKTPYLTRSLLNRTPTGITDRISTNDPELLHARMRELRDRWYLVGEVPWPGWQFWRLKSLIYVRKDSPYFDALVSSLRRVATVEPDRIDLNTVN